MTGAISHIALYAPVAASSSIFAFRRAERGIDNMEDKPIFGTANLLIAGGQTFKGIDAAKQIALVDKEPLLSEGAVKRLEGMKKSVSSNKILNCFGKIFETISKCVNGVICLASLVKVLESDDKADAATREILGLGLMFSCEKGAKKVLGIRKIGEENGKLSPKQVEHSLLRKNNFLDKQISAMDDFLKSKNLFEKVSKESVHGAAKGVLFVLASIGGYKLGSIIADWVLGKKENTKNK